MPAATKFPHDHPFQALQAYPSTLALLNAFRVYWHQVALARSHRDLELPGLDKEDVNISIIGNRLIVW
ncbi:hypothetical protein H1R20_g4191, partial [Candolleomyces eurysporus]